MFMTLVPADTGPWANFLAGIGAGLVNAMVLNPMSAIKYKTWGREVNRGMLAETFGMWTKGGFKPFGNGLLPTVYRDVVFGGCYTFLRLEYQHHWQASPQHQWVGNLLAAAVATVVSGPFNLARNVQYSTSSLDTAPTTRQVLQELWQQTKARRTLWEKWHHVQNRLRIGWGTARVAVGMALGHFIYDECFLWYQSHQRDIERVEQRVEERFHLIPARRNTLAAPRRADAEEGYENDDDDDDVQHTPGATTTNQ